MPAANPQDTADTGAINLTQDNIDTVVQVCQTLNTFFHFTRIEHSSLVVVHEDSISDLADDWLRVRDVVPAGTGPIVLENVDTEVF